MDRNITLEDLRDVARAFLGNARLNSYGRQKRSAFIKAVLARFGAVGLATLEEPYWPLAYEMIHRRTLGVQIDPATYKLEGGMAEGGAVKNADLKPGEVAAVVSGPSVYYGDPTPEQAEELKRAFGERYPSLRETYQRAEVSHPGPSRHANDVFRHLGEELNLHREAQQLADAHPEDKQAGQQFPAPGYERLHAVLRDAHDQAAYGKGNERHANDLPFHLQRMQTISQGFDSPVGMAYQVTKKLQEGLQMTDAGARRRELLGALNYLAGIVIFLDDKEAK